MTKKNIDLKRKTVAIIPAKKSSERLIGKNTLNLHGQPLIDYSIKYAQRAGIDKIYVTSDCDSILAHSKKMDVGIIKRPVNLSDNLATTLSVIKHSLDIISESIPLNEIEYIVLLQPTSPLRKLEDITRGVTLYKAEDFDSVFSVGVNNRKIGIINGDKKYSPVNYSFGQRGQDKKREYFENGSLYIFNPKNIQKGFLLGDKVGVIVYEERSSNLDIDYLDDFELAEFYLKRKKNPYKYLLE